MKARLGAQPFIWKWVKICMWMKSHFHMKGWTPRLVLRKRFKEIWKWPIARLLGCCLRKEDISCKSQRQWGHAPLSLQKNISIAEMQGSLIDIPPKVRIGKWQAVTFLSGECLKGHVFTINWKKLKRRSFFSILRSNLTLALFYFTLSRIQHPLATRLLLWITIILIIWWRCCISVRLWAVSLFP